MIVSARSLPQWHVWLLVGDRGILMWIPSFTSLPWSWIDRLRLGSGQRQRCGRAAEKPNAQRCMRGPVIEVSVSTQDLDRGKIQNGYPAPRLKVGMCHGIELVRSTLYTKHSRRRSP